MSPFYSVYITSYLELLVGQQFTNVGVCALSFPPFQDPAFLKHTPAVGSAEYHMERRDPDKQLIETVNWLSPFNCFSENRKSFIGKAVMQL
jgi:hypothetical protein